MARAFSFDTVLAASSPEGQRVEVALAVDPMPPEDRANHVAEMVATVPWTTVRPALAWFAALGHGGALEQPRNEGDTIVIPLPHQVQAPWQAAMLLNLIDFALAEDDEELRLADRVTLYLTEADELTIETLYMSLNDQLNAARQVMTAKLPKDTWIDEYSESEWPQDAEYYAFDLTAQLKDPLGESDLPSIQSLLNDLESLVAWMGFSTEDTGVDWQDQGKMLFNGEIAVSGSEISWRADGPPSDIALACTWIEMVLTVHSKPSIDAWAISIAPMDP